MFVCVHVFVCLPVCVCLCVNIINYTKAIFRKMVREILETLMKPKEVFGLYFQCFLATIRAT